MYVSRDRGEHWDFRETNPPQEFADVTVSPYYATDGIVLAMGLDAGLMVSRDRGDHWSTTTSFPGWQPSYSGPINAFATGPASIGINVADYVSLDLGYSWSCLGSQTPPAPPEVPEGSTLLLLGSGLAGLAGYLWRKKR
ncbi:MAG: hypothetical protein CVU38_09710 [Chloroflexi bacterium HGW-Chloroflexi-1]|nr:MAG: hypothetical protein CVU38_09710 [Chloroflexi bacterium HGW-Chloroflexi-1]